MARGGVRIARIGGVDVRADYSLGFLAVLLTYNMWLFFSDRFRFPTLSGGVALSLAGLTTVLFVSSILAHELAHAVMFRARGVPVLGITLYMFGGYTQGGSESKRPVDEFLVSVVGPVTTAAIGVLFLLLHAAAGGVGAHPWRSMFGYLALLNLLMAGFNLLPGFPLDGGRILLAALWRATGSRARGTWLAARIGQVLGLLVGAAGLVQLTSGRDVFGLWSIFVGVILFQSSSAAVAQTRHRAAIDSATAGQVMAPPPPVVPAGLTVAEALERHLTGHEGEAFPVMEDDRVIGFVSPRMARATALDRPVRDAMVGPDAVALAYPEESMRDLTERLAGGGAQIVLVMDHGRLVGVIEPEDLARFVRARGRGRGRGRGQRGRAAPSTTPARPDAPPSSS